MDRGHSHESIKPKNTRNRWEMKVWRRIENGRKMSFFGLTKPTLLCSSTFCTIHSLSNQYKWVAYLKQLLLTWVINPTCHFLIQANLKCQIFPLAFKLTISGPIIGIFNFIPIGPLYFQSYKYISGFLKWIPNSPQNHFFWICAPRSHQILAQILFLTDLVITLSHPFQNIMTFIKRHITI